MNCLEITGLYIYIYNFFIIIIVFEKVKLDHVNNTENKIELQKYDRIVDIGI